MNIDIIVPTLDRPEKLARCVASIARQRLPEDVVLKTVIVHDWQKRQAFAIWNDYMLHHAWGVDIFGYVCDDVEFHDNALHNAIVSMMLKFPDMDGLVGFAQNIQGKDGFSASAMGLIGRRFAQRFNERACFCPDYVSFHADSELGEYARSVNKFYYDASAQLTHYHPSHYHNEQDATHASVRQSTKVEGDKRTYNERRAKGLLWGKSFKLVNHHQE